ncbi:hypothetical protein CYLTODRAFT_423307 [Cylindrobasidium torrendii FP15055 ss-10]|uniref:Uncharacterized protein n=1 Tax=Cylindrobasidium torrendii FP15055 ss-10 TaxID=1314674 RepID=A0A0D7B8E3_9AGAR|nr:hypothetical protein CYLTODRAFT_423307 [Cylindrobasidium torrendii FP15055 ss-10]
MVIRQVLANTCFESILTTHIHDFIDIYNAIRSLLVLITYRMPQAPVDSDATGAAARHERDESDGERK